MLSYFDFAQKRWVDWVDKGAAIAELFAKEGMVGISPSP